MNTPFSPAAGKTVNIDIAATTANVQVSSGSGMTQVRVMNDGSATVWIEFGIANTIAATTTASIPVATKSSAIFTAPSPVWVAGIAAGTTGKVYFTPGQGV